VTDSRINVYHNLSVMLNAGLPISRALKTVEKQGRFGRVIGRLEPEVARGQSLSDAVDIYQRKFEKLDISLIKVGEHTGQMAEIFELLSEWYGFCQRIKRAAANGLIIPVIYIHLAGFLIPFIKCMLKGFELNHYLQGVFHFFAVLYIPVVLIFAVIKFTPKQGFLRRVLDTIFILIPYFGKTIRELELSRYCKVFSTTYKAGVPIVRCSEMALDSVVNQVMKHRLENAHENVKRGDEMSRGFGAGLPSEFKAIWEVGEESGDLDETCWRLGNMHAENAENRFKVISKVVPLMINMGVLGFLAYMVIMFWIGLYSSMIGN